MTVYTDCTSLQLAFRYAGAPASPWAGEVWQTGLRLLVSTEDAFDVNAGRVEPDPFGAQDASVSRVAGIWNIAQGWSGVTIGGTAITDADVDAILEETRKWMDITRQYLANSYVLESVRIYPMLPGSGSPWRAGVSATAPVIAEPNTTALNPAAANLMPPDVSLAVSLGTGTRGPSGRGRMFLGGLDRSLCTTQGLVSATPGGAIGNATKTFINGLRGINSAGIPSDVRFTPVIYTKVPNKNGSNADTGSVISQLRIGDEFDTQRRRDHQRVDVYTSFGPIV